MTPTKILAEARQILAKRYGEQEEYQEYNEEVAEELIGHIYPIIAKHILGNRLDRPELREKIAQWLFYRGKTTATVGIDYIPKWYEVPDEIKKAYRKEADQILAPFPTEEEIRKDERERIFRGLTDLSFRHNPIGKQRITNFIKAIRDKP